MLRVVVESAKGLPKKKLGNPDPFTAVVYKGKSYFKSFIMYCIIVCGQKKLAA